MMINKSLFIKISFTTLMTLLAVASCKLASSNKTKGIVVSSIDEFKLALGNGEKSILVNDIDFNHEIIAINHNVNISAKDNSAEFKNVYFSLIAPNVVDERIEVSFSNIVFDDSFELGSIDLSAPTSFEDAFGSTRDENKCFSGNNGYYSLNLDGCVIKNYASEVGPAIYVENHKEALDYKRVNVNNCKFYNNYSAWDTLHLSNDKLEVSITNSEFYSNYSYRGAGFCVVNGSSTIDKINVHDNHFVPYEDYKDNFQLAGGGVYIGGLDVKMSNSYIVNNETTYGGGLAVSTPFAGNKTMVLENVCIKNNKAVYGGGIALFSLFGQPLTFIDCEILSNEAQYGSALYTEVYARWIQANNGGLVSFFFSTFGLNTATDNNTFKFYQEEGTKGQLGTISLKGCVAIGNDVYESTNNDYNYIATKEQALLDGVINEQSIESISDGLFPIKGSKGDIKVKADVYSTWSSFFEGSNQARKIGKNIKKTSAFPAPFILMSVGFILVLGCLIALLFSTLKNRKNSKTVPVEQASVDNETPDLRKEYYESLSEREKQIVSLMIALKKRKDIAEELNYSENTIKKDLTSIYSKLHVADKFELISKYKDMVN